MKPAKKSGRPMQAEANANNLDALLAQLRIVIQDGRRQALRAVDVV